MPIIVSRSSLAETTLAGIASLIAQQNSTHGPCFTWTQSQPRAEGLFLRSRSAAFLGIVHGSQATRTQHCGRVADHSGVGRLENISAFPISNSRVSGCLATKAPISKDGRDNFASTRLYT